MKLNIEAEFLPTNFCVLSCIKCYLKQRHLPYEAMLTCNWTFGEFFYQNENDKNTAVLPYSMSPLENLQRYHGTRVSAIQRSDASMDIIYDEINAGRPIIVYVDSYDCEWMTYYHKIHADHYIMVIGHQEDDMFICIDPYLDGIIHYFTRQDIEKGLKMLNLSKYHLCGSDDKLFLFQHIGGQTESILPSIEYSAEKYLSTYNNYLVKFCESLTDTELIRSLLEEAPITTSRIYFEIKSIVDSRNDFLKAIEYEISHFQNTKLGRLGIEVMYADMAKRWKTFMSSLYRIPYTEGVEKKKEIINKAQDKLKIIIDCEKEIAKTILKG